MSRRLVVETGPIETRAALIEAGVPVEFHVFPQGRASLTGEIRLGRVTTVEKSMGALFLDLGLERPGFLKFKDAGRPLPTEGGVLAVEIIREPAGTKGARVTTRLSRPLDRVAAGTAAPACLLPAPQAVVRLAQAVAATGPLDLITQGDLPPGLRALAPQAHHGRQPLFEAEGLEDGFLAALERRQSLPGGITLTIDETEALSAIDIDGGGQGARTANEAGARAAALEIRRRNLGGQILVDFIGAAPDIAAGRQALAAALAVDPRRPELARGDLGGLVLVTRTRQGASLRGAVTEPSPESDGRRLTAAHLAARLLRRAESLARHHPGRALAARVPPDVLDFARDRFGEWVKPLGAPLHVEAVWGDGRDVEVSLAP